MLLLQYFLLAYLDVQYVLNVISCIMQADWELIWSSHWRRDLYEHGKRRRRRKQDSAM